MLAIDFDASNVWKTIRFAIEATRSEHYIALSRSHTHHGHYISTTSRQHHWYNVVSSSLHDQQLTPLSDWDNVGFKVREGEFYTSY